MSLSLCSEIALRSLLAHNVAISLTAHNMANANNEIYTRQTALLRSSMPLPVVNSGGGIVGHIGTGVEVKGLIRSVDVLVDTALRSGLSRSAYLDSLSNALSIAEGIMSEPTNGLFQALDDFRRSWIELSAQPDSVEARINLVSTAEAFLSRLRSIATALKEECSRLSERISSSVGKLNNLFKTIAELNSQIATSKAHSLSPNDLMDMRDEAVRSAATLMKVDMVEHSNGMVSLYSFGHVLVQGNVVRHISFSVHDGNARMIFKDTGDEVPFSEGELGGLVEARNFILWLIGRLCSLAIALRDAVNSLHRCGVGLDGSSGVDFFAGDNIWDMRVNDEVKVNPRRIAASLSGDEGDGENAYRIAEAFSRGINELGDVSPIDFYLSTAFQLGSKLSAVKDELSFFETLVSSLRSQREAISSVSLDEEVVDLMRFQQALLIASKVLRVADEITLEMLKTVMA